MKREDKIFEWLIYNNLLYKELNKLITYKLVKDELQRMQENEIKSTLKHRGNWEESVFPIFSGEICYLENSLSITKENIEQSKQYVKEWMFKHIFNVTKDGIIFSDECKSKQGSRLTTTREYNNHHISIPKFPSQHFFGKDERHKRKCDIKLIKDCEIYSDIVFRPNIHMTSYQMSNLFVADGKEKNLDKKSLFDENGVLRYKIKECQDLYLDMQTIYFQPLVSVQSFKNFPNIVHGNLVFMDWDSIVSFDYFPPLCEKEVIFKNCRIPFNVVLPEGITINDNLVCIDCVNDYNFLIGILKYNWNIKGKIYTSLYTGDIKTLRKIAFKEHWI